jgi:hypothetical protein
MLRAVRFLYSKAETCKQILQFASQLFVIQFTVSLKPLIDIDIDLMAHYLHLYSHISKGGIMKYLNIVWITATTIFLLGFAPAKADHVFEYPGPTLSIVEQNYEIPSGYQRNHTEATTDWFELDNTLNALGFFSASGTDPSYVLTGQKKKAATKKATKKAKKNGTVPEPSTLFLFGLGLAGIGFLRKQLSKKL